MQPTCRGSSSFQLFSRWRRQPSETAEAEPHETVVDAKQAYIAKTAADHDNNAIFPMLATLSGAMLASGVGWYLVRPGPRTTLS